MKRYFLPDIAQAIIISQYYPLDNFLGEDRKEIIQIAGSRRTGTKTLKPVSLRRFRKAIGVAPVRESSGSSAVKTKKAGSSLCRCQLWLWSFGTFERKKSQVKSATINMRQLTELWTTIHNDTKHIKLTRSTFASKFVECLFYDLLAARK
jgi:hypothetical protein